MLHALTIGLSAFLLFNLQPMIAKIILPLFGGGPSIWLTSMIFFQFLLLAGYASVHRIVIKLNITQQAVCFLLIIALALLFLPLQIRCTQFAIPPAAKILLLLLTSVGLPYFLLTCTSPLFSAVLYRSQPNIALSKSIHFICGFQFWLSSRIIELSPFNRIEYEQQPTG